MTHDAKLAAVIDHTLLDPSADISAITQAVNIAFRYQCASVCLNSSRVQAAAAIAAGTDLTICTVIGFPSGATTTTSKAAETSEARENGATEFDMVLHLGQFFDGDFAGIAADVAAVKKAAGEHIVKVIIESAALGSLDNIAQASRISVEAGADYVKTSTGYHASGGATVEAITAMRAAVGPDIGVKASGGIRTLEDAQAMLAAGASRIGASKTITIIGAE